MEMRIVKIYKTCEVCKGTGIETNDRIYGEEGYQSWECRLCQGHGEVLINTRKEIEEDERLLSARNI